MVRKRKLVSILFILFFVVTSIFFPCDLFLNLKDDMFVTTDELNDLVKEQLQSKLYTMPEEIRCKIQKTLQKIINEGSTNIITIIL